MRSDTILKTGDVGAEQSQADIAYEKIKQDILTCVIEPKSRLTEVELVRRYDFGRAAVRSALIRLNHEALVDALPRYGYVVAGHDELGALDLFQIQLLLDPAAGRLAAGRVDARLLAELDVACAETQLLGGVTGAVQFLQANTNFHAAVAQASGNALLARYIRIFYERMERLLYASGRIELIVQDVAHTHQDIIEQLVCGNAEGAEAAIRDQISRSHQIMLRHLQHLR